MCGVRDCDIERLKRRLKFLSRISIGRNVEGNDIDRAGRIVLQCLLQCLLLRIVQIRGFAVCHRDDNSGFVLEICIQRICDRFYQRRDAPGLRTSQVANDFVELSENRRLTHRRIKFCGDIVLRIHSAWNQFPEAFGIQRIVQHHIYVGLICDPMAVDIQNHP